jgi:hypothetical protein
MAGACCAKPVTRIIRVAEFEAGILGLDQALRNVYVGGRADEEEMRRWRAISRYRFWRRAPPSLTIPISRRII